MIKLDFSNEYFSPQSVLECGQIFRYSPFQKGYKVFSDGKACYVYEEGNKTVVVSEDADYFFDYFDLNRDYGAIVQRAKGYGIPALTAAAAYGRGIRILNQDEEEMMYSFIVSQNNHIPRIKSILNRLCEELGEKREFMGESYFTFPKSKILATKDREFYRRIGAGYRDIFLSETASRLNEEGIDALKKLDGKTLKQRLLSYKGIGKKVADCVALFGFGRTESFPVDTWMMKVYREDFGGTLTDARKVSEYFETLFGSDSGYMQQYLFYYKREQRE